MAQPTPSRIPLYAPMGLRDSSPLKDSRLYNGYAEKGMEEKEVLIFKRPGFGVRAAVGTGAGQGVFYWSGHVYSIFGGMLYQDTTLIGAVAAGEAYTFAPCLGATPKLFLHNSTLGYTYDPVNGLVAVTDVNWPGTAHTLTPGAVYLDGTTYVGGVNANIYGDALNDPQTWDPLNFLIAQIEPEGAVALAKQLVYVVCLKATSTEVFYDAGNAVGSPLGPVPGSKTGVGCRAAGTVAKAGDDLCWVGTTTEGDVQVMLMTKVHAEPISTPPVERLLKPLDFSIAWSWSAKVSGHRFYAFTLPLSNLTLVFDLTSASWYFWTDTNGNYVPIISSTYDGSGNPVLQHATNGNLYSLNASYLSDDNGNIPVQIYTPPYDGGLRVAKTNAKVEVVGDRIPTTVNLSWSDDDYQTFNTPQPIDLSIDRPWLQDGSSFARRAFLLTHFAPTELRLKALDITAAPGNL